MLDTGDFGPYRIIKRLGVGGMAETFEATRKGPGGFEQRVCLKRVLPAFSENQEFVEQFEREARLAAQLRHSNIVGIIDFGHEQHVHYMALELVDGIDMRSLLAAQPQHKLSPDIVALIGLDLAYALDYAHSLCGQIAADGKLASGIVHRDVSPANVLVSRSGEVKLADFGIAKVINNTVATTTGTIRGKIPYMAPEQMKGISTDGRADLFSLGVMLFEAAAGKRPFEGSHDVEVMTRILDGNRLRLENIAPDVPEKLKTAINNLLEHDRDKRTVDANALIDQLANTTHIMRARRELAALVEERLGGTDTREHLLHIAGPEDETELADQDTEEGVTGPLKETELFDESFNFMPTSAERPSAVDKQDIAQELQSIRGRQRSWLGWTIPLWMLALSVAVGVMWFSSRQQAANQEGHASSSAESKSQESKPSDTVIPSAQKNVLNDTNTQGVPDVILPPTEAREKGEAKSKPDSATTNSPSGKIKLPKIKETPTTGLLYVTVVPFGDVWIDGDNRGQAKAKLPIKLKPGTHKIGVGREKVEKSKTIRIRAGESVPLIFELD